MSCEDDEESYVFYSRLGTESFLSGKLRTQIYQLNKTSKSKSEGINSSSLVKIYCDMELDCGSIKGGWAKIAYKYVH